jgi:CHRD domain
VRLVRARSILRAVVGALLLLPSMLMIGVAPAAAMTHIVANLDGDQVVPGPGDPEGVAFVQLQIEPGEGFICATWGLVTVTPIAAQIRTGDEGEAGPSLVDLPVGDGGCNDPGELDGAMLQSILDDLEGHYVEVQTDEFPEGAIRGQLVTEEVTAVFVAHHACPEDIQTVAQFDAAGALAACEVAIDESDLSPAPGGLPYVPEPILFNVKLALTDAAGDTHTELLKDGGGTCGDTSCEPPGYTYWFVNELRSTTFMPAGPSLLDISTSTDFHRLAVIRVDDGLHPLFDLVPGTDGTAFELDTTGTDTVGVRAIYFVGDDPNPILPGPGATVPPTSTLELPSPSSGGPGALLAALAITMTVVIGAGLAILRRRSR